MLFRGCVDEEAAGICWWLMRSLTCGCQSQLLLNLKFDAVLKSGQSPRYTLEAQNLFVIHGFMSNLTQLNVSGLAASS